MGNQLIDQCTGASSRTEGFDPDIIHHSKRQQQQRIRPTTATRIPLVQAAYQHLVSQKSIDYSLQTQKATFRPTEVRVFSQEALYIGWTKNEMPHGPGQLYFDNHNYLQAVFKEGEAECEDAVYIEATGNYYRGGFKKSKQHGWGTLKCGNEVIIGTFENGSAQGKGEKHFGDGRVYIGHFRNGKMEGKGTLTLPNNSFYVGYFRQDMRSGIGNLKTPAFEYFGPYKGDKMEGKGTIVFTDGTKFEGWLQKDRIEGYGEWHRGGGVVEKGNYSMDLPA